MEAHDFSRGSVHIPEDDSLDVLSPFNTKVILDYGDKVLELSGNVCEVPQKKKLLSQLTYDDADENYEHGYNECIDDILGQ